MENKENDRIVTFKDLWNLLMQRILIIAAVALVGGGLFFLATKMLQTPEYESRGTLYIQRQSNVSSVGDASSEFSLALKLVNDCTYFIKSHTVLDQVIRDLDLGVSYRQLYNSVSTHNPDNTRFLEVTVTAASPEQAKQIVDAICVLAPQVIEQTMGSQQISQFETGTLNTTPSNQTSILLVLVVMVLLAALTYGVFLVIYLMDDRFRSDEDVEKILGLTVLGSIPDASVAPREGSGYYGYGKKSAKKKKKKGTGGK